jgi:predicted site-specific integrase-resolvase
MNGYMTVRDMATLWGVSERQVQIWCKSGKIEGVLLFGKSWAIPESAAKPTRTINEKPGRKPKERATEKSDVLGD